jgi:hypothetical protein
MQEIQTKLEDAIRLRDYFSVAAIILRGTLL